MENKILNIRWSYKRQRHPDIQTKVKEEKINVWKRWWKWAVRVLRKKWRQPLRDMLTWMPEGKCKVGPQQPDKQLLKKTWYGKHEMMPTG